MNDMSNKEFIIDKFLRVEKLGFVQSHRSNNTGIGKTFEDYVGVVENNLNEPDLAGYEIKTHRKESNSYVTIFTKAPSFPDNANTYLKDTFGEVYDDNPTLKKLHTSIFANRKNSYAGKYSFKLDVSSFEHRIYIEVYSLADQLLDRTCGYTYDDIQSALICKLNNLFFVTAETKIEDGVELFHFNCAEIYSNPSLDNFVEMLEKGEIMYDIRIGSYRSGRNFGRAHDHGSGFRIKESNLLKLYQDYEKIQK